MPARFRSSLTLVLSGVVLTLLVAWCMPLLLATRGVGPVAGQGRVDRLVADPVLEQTSAGTRRKPARVEVTRGMFSDLCVAWPASDPADAERPALWPDQGVYAITDIDRVRKRRTPTGCVLAPPAGEADRYARIDTTLAGWPFRAFAAEAWWRWSSVGNHVEPVPEVRWKLFIGTISATQALVALRPLPLGLVADILFWTGVSWLVVAIPRTIRRRRRERFGRCGGCGHALDPQAVVRPERCPECGAALAHDPLGFARNPEMRYQNAYVWFVFVSSLDIMLTWKILDRGGIEVNPVAALVIDEWGMHGAIAFKFALMMFVIVTCEITGRVRPRTGKALSIAAVAVSAFPVVWSLVLLALHEFFP